ncbi:DUF6990 domain-containing protein [Aliidiomarina soli]|uniref:DUF4304 domain-containing protein n=1 Tax=Aliidiomarina soli TaxID=1928574 RepID=A0A432WE26_9GAMM|nr:hypothetical protein [Aliidiomarina soli]RUO31147.1 hypothetical protein CWE14_11675 [Aliidiomarina soli]
MKKAEMIKYLKSKYKAEKFGSDWEFTLKDSDSDEGELAVMVGLSGTPQRQLLLALPSMNVPWHRKLYLELFQGKDGFVRPFSVGKQYHYYSDSGILEEEHIDMMIDYCFEWFKEQIQPDVIAANITQCYEKNVCLPPARWQFTHIIACVLKGDVEKLQSYLDAFKRGDRMEFIPIIQQEYFERAIPLAEKYRSGELVSPVDF